ncbi:MATE family efflux transporter [Paenibacillus sp. H1-7]|uniref:MATE family efflux transporter n=1 Tax=Paenibacillus sp. H1-7 TaxID=2282849 RepID=UPI001EF965F7|nr:MATE family efflux transporter [Paenibacillus sp. H1-7]ULL15898.1 MATE family efflux transporter [Paenibacillus sp. H1-7]
MKNRSELPAAKKELSLWYLSWPIAIEMFLQFLMGTVDTLMVTHISDYASSAVGLSNQILNATSVMFTMINSGAGILIAQKLGSGNVEQARRTAAITIKANIVVGALLSVAMFFSAEWLLGFMQAPEEVLPLAVTYLSIVGSNTIVISLYAAASSIIRNTGNTRGPMLIVMGMNAIHLVLNYLFIYGEFGIPQLGIFGVALSTVISRTVALILALIVMYKSFKPGFVKSDWKGFDKPLAKEVWRIGWPMTFNAASWNYTQAIIFAIVASMGAATLASFTYMNTIQSLPWLVGMSVAMASQIRVGHLYGARNFEPCYRSAYSALWAGLLFVLTTSLLLLSVGRTAIGWFTSDAEIIRIAMPLFFINVVLQPLKMVNQAFSFSLNGIGDTRFTALTNMLSMWLVAAACSYLFGIALGWGIIGIYMAMIADETVRGILVAIRWRRRGRLPEAAADNLSFGHKHMSL